MSRIAVVAFGGNALITDAEHDSISIPHQYETVTRTVPHLVGDRAVPSRDIGGFAVRLEICNRPKAAVCSQLALRAATSSSLGSSLI